MYRVCLVNGELFEMQSGGNTQAHLDTLKKNAINAGYAEEDIEVKWVTNTEWAAILEANTPAPTYKDKRKAEYPPVGDQFDMIWHDKKDGTTIWYDTVKAIKDKYPKE